MVKHAQGCKAVGRQTSAEQKRNGGLVSIQDVPGERLSGTSERGDPFVEKEIVATVLIGDRQFQVLFGLDGEGFDYGQAVLA